MKLSDEQIKHMVERFLRWRLPEAFNPDGGISFQPMFNEHTAHPMKAEPTGTNLFDYGQATEMVRFMAEGMPFIEGLREVLEPFTAFVELRDRDHPDDPDDIRAAAYSTGLGRDSEYAERSAISVPPAT